MSFKQEDYTTTKSLRSGEKPWTIRRRVKVTESRKTTETVEVVEPAKDVPLVPNVTTKRRQKQLADFFEPPPNYTRPGILKKPKKSPPVKYAFGKPLSIKDIMIDLNMPPTPEMDDLILSDDQVKDNIAHFGMLKTAALGRLEMQHVPASWVGVRLPLSSNNQ